MWYPRWYPKKNINYSNYYGKLVCVTFNYNSRSFCGILDSISDANMDGDYTIRLSNPTDECIDLVTSDIVGKIIYDNSLYNIGKLELIKKVLYKKLNYDIVKYVIKKYLIDDIIYL